MQGAQIAIEFNLSFQNLRKCQLVGSFSLLAEFFLGFIVLFFLLVGWIYWNALAAFEKRGEHSIGFWKLGELTSDFWKASWAYKDPFQKKRGPLAFFENSNEVQKLNAKVPCIRV